MMRSLWIILSTLAIANLLGIAGFVGWLGLTGRLSGERMVRIREMLVKTIAEEKAQLAAEDEARKQEEAKAAADAKMRVPPESSTEALSRVRDEDDLAVQRLARTREEIRQMQVLLDARQAALDRDKAELAAAQKALEAKKTETVTTLGAEQFRQALGALEAQKPADARKVLQAMIDEGRKDNAVTYLAAMTERARSRIVTEFIKSDQKLAAQLLEELRTRGLESKAPAGAAASSGPVPGS